MACTSQHRAEPFLFSLIEPLRQRILKGSAWARAAEARTDHLSALPDSTARRYLAQHVVLVGCGRVGSALAGQLREKVSPSWWVTARTLNSGIQTIVRAPNGEEAELLRSERADVALHPHGTLAQALLEVALAKWTTSATPPRPHP